MDIQKTEKTALLVIDAQKGLFEKNTPIFCAEQFLENILELIKRAHLAETPVIFIQHEDPKYLVKGSNSWALHARLKPQPHDWFVEKSHGNAFKAADLDPLLKSLGVKRVVVAGLVTHGCVKSTCLGGLDVGFQVVLAGDAHSSYSKEAGEMIRKWNVLLAEKRVLVKDTCDITF